MNCKYIYLIFFNQVPKIFIKSGYSRQGNSETEFGLWVNGNDNKPENAFLVLGRGEAMRER
jgi:hypothetical protein